MDIKEIVIRSCALASEFGCDKNAVLLTTAMIKLSEQIEEYLQLQRQPKTREVIVVQNTSKMETDQLPDAKFHPIPTATDPESTSPDPAPTKPKRTRKPKADPTPSAPPPVPGNAADLVEPSLPSKEELIEKGKAAAAELAAVQTIDTGVVYPGHPDLARPKTLPNVPAQEPYDEPVVPTIEELRMLFGKASQAGHKEDLRKLLSTYGAARLPEVDPKHYATIKTVVEGWTK